jgi:hypothetical protein
VPANVRHRWQAFFILKDISDVTIQDKTYDDLLTTIINQLLAWKTAGDEITGNMCVAGLDPDKDNRRVRDYAIDILQVDKADFKAAMNRRRIAIKLGGKYPDTASEFVQLVMSRRHTALKYNGTVTEPGDNAVNPVYVTTKIRAEAAELGLRFPRADL